MKQGRKTDIFNEDKTDNIEKMRQLQNNLTGRKSRNPMKHVATALCLTFIFMNLILAMQFAPRLIGFGCDGSPVMLAKYESDFPRCDTITRLLD